MMTRAVLVTLLGMLGLSMAINCPKQKTSPGREIVCYTSIKDVEELTESICRCTTLVHQGHNVQNFSTSDFESLQKSLKEINPPMQFMLSIEDPTKIIGTSAVVRQEATARLIRVLKDVDGVELNMTAGSKDRLFQFVKGIRDELVKKSYDKRIFLALPTKAEDLAKQFNLKDLTKYVDLFTVATHYLVDDDEAYNTFHPSRLMGLFDLINTDSLIDLISGLGAPKRKILVSVPASAYRFTLKDASENAPRSSTMEKEPAVIDRKQLCDSMSKGEWTVERDEDLTAPYAFKNKTWIAFEDNISIGIKGKYALLRDLPGLAVYNVENDFKTNCGKPVTHEIHHSFTDFKRKSRAAVLNALEDDLHQSQITYSNHVKSSDFRVVRVVDTEGHIRAVRENTQTEFSCTKQGYFVHPRSCNRFYRCVKFNQEVEDYSVFEFDCPAGLAFDERTEVCVWPGSLSEGSPCPGSSEIAPVQRVRFQCPSEPGYYADPQNGRWFFACIDLGGPELMAYEFRCPYGLVFDEEKLVCEWPWLVRGYSGTEYTKTEYDYRGYGGSSSTQGTGGYVTGGIPHGFHPTGSTSGSGGYGEHSGVGIVSGGHAGGSGGYEEHSGVGHAGGSGGYGQHSGVGIVSGGDAGGSGGYGQHSGVGIVSGGHSGGSGGYEEHSGVEHAGGSGGYGQHSGVGLVSGGDAGGAGGYGQHSGVGIISGGDAGGAGGYGQHSGVGIISGGDAGGAGGYGQHSGVGIVSGGDAGGSGGYGQHSGVGVISGGDAGGSGGYGQHSGAGVVSGGHAGGSGFSGAAGVGYGGSSISHSGSAGHDYSGISNTGYTGSTVDSHAGSDASLYSGQSGYTGTTSHSYQGGYAGSTSTQYAGSAGGDYSGSTGGDYYGSSGFDYSQTTDKKTSDSGYSTSDNSLHSGSSSSDEYSGSVGDRHTTTAGVHYSGSSGTSYTGGVQTGIHGTDYSGVAAGGHDGTKYSGGSGGNVHIGLGGTGYSQAGGAGSTTSSGHFGGGYAVGGSYPGGAGQNSYPGFAGSVGTSSGTTYVGSAGVSSSHDQTPTVTLVGHGQGLPSVTYLPNTPRVPGQPKLIPVSPGHDQGFTSDVHQSDITSTYFGSSVGADGYSTKGVIGGTTIHHGNGGISHGYGINAGSNGFNVTLSGGRVPSIGNTPYHVNLPTGGYDIGKGSTGTGTIITGNTIQGSISTDDSSSGSVFTHGGSSGTVFTGSSDQGTIVTNSNYPGYVSTGGDSPGYVINGGVKTVYHGSVSPGTFIHGTATPSVSLTGPSVPGTILKGDASPGVVLTGQTAPGVVLGGTIEQGTIVGSSGSHQFTDTGYTAYQGSTGSGRTDTTYIGAAKTGTVPVSHGYETNEYHDNGGRGTIRFNNGYETSKFAESDIPDYRPAGPTIPDTVLTGGVVQSSSGRGSGIATQTPVYPTQRPGSLTPSGFTKTGPTKTGITTATLGGRGSYVISTGKPKPTLNPDHIGAKAFEGNVAGYTKSSTESSNSERTYSSSSSTQSQDTSYVDTSKITLGPSVSRGYSYPKPSIPFVTGVASSTPSPVSPTDGNVAVTTPTPFLNIEVYNNPHRTVQDSVPVTASPADGHSYSYSYDKSSNDQYQGAVGKVPTGFGSRRPLTPTATPVTYTTGPLENFKTTVFEAAKIPVAVSSVQPVIDTGYKTIVSPTVIPVTLHDDQFGTRKQGRIDVTINTSHQQSGYGDRTGYVPVTSPPQVIPSEYDAVKIGTPAIPNIALPDVTYQQPTLPPETKYVPSTTPSSVGYSYGTLKPSFGDAVTPVSVSGSLKPQTQYLPPSSVSPAVGVTYRKPFPVPGITYQQSTPQSDVYKIQGFTGSSDTTSFSSSYSKVDYSNDARTTIESGTRAGGSPTNLDISRDEVGKLITNYDRGAVKYTPSIYDTYSGSDLSNTKTSSVATGDFSRKQITSSKSYSGYASSTPGLYGQTPPPFTTTYTGGYSRPSSASASYEVTTKPSTAVGKGKVIVKWSDLHPLLLGKLGAECTCRADPFGNLRGPGKKLISSSRGKVDLSNYDESEIYVDLEKEGSYEDGDYVTNYESSSIGPVKVINKQGPIIVADPNSGTSSPQFGKPSSNYLPSVSSAFTPITTPCTNTGGYDLRGTTGEGGNVPGNAYIPSNHNSDSGHRSGKALNNGGTNGISIGKAGAAFDRYGPGGLRGSDEVLEGVADCARPGLFRHPNFCNKFYACHWDQWKKRFTLHVFNCPVHLTFDSSAGACNWPSKGPACQDDNLLV